MPDAKSNHAVANALRDVASMATSDGQVPLANKLNIMATSIDSGYTENACRAMVDVWRTWGRHCNECQGYVDLALEVMESHFGPIVKS